MNPSDLRGSLPYPQTPWKISPGVISRLQPESNRYKITLLHSADPEAVFVQRCFMQDKPPGYSISKVCCTYNHSLQIGFLAHLTHIEEEAQKFRPGWEDGDLPSERKVVVERWKALTQPFSPLTITIEEESETLKYARVLPLWHGTDPTKARLC